MPRDSPPHRTAFDLRPASIVERFGLKNPIFEATASYGHFGNRPYRREVTCSTMAGKSRKKSNSSGGKSWTRWEVCAANSAYCKHLAAMPTADSPGTSDYDKAVS